MSNDIRKFFSPTNKKKASVPEVRTGQRKRGPIVIDSDSDEEIKIPVQKKRTKPSEDNDKQQKTEKSKAVASKVKSQYFHGESCSPNDIFGKAPIRRDNSRHIVKKTISKNENKEFHLDEDFEKELLMLDSEGLEKEASEASHGKEQKVNGDNDVTTLNNETKSNMKRMMFDLDELPNKRPRRSHDISPLKNSPSKKVESPSKKSPSPKKRVASPMKIVKSPTDTVSSPTKRISSPLKKLDSPIKKTLSTDSSSNSITSFLDKTSSPPAKKSASPIKQISSPVNKVRSPKLWSPVKKTLSPVKKVTSPLKKQNHSQEDCNKNIKDSQSSQNTSQHLKLKEVNKTSPSSKEASHKPNLKAESPRKHTPSEHTVDRLTHEVANLWVEKYKPFTTKQIIGQQGDKSCVNKLIKWINNWHKNQTGNKKFVKPSPWAKNDDGAYFKAALLSGPPGVGKTTTAHLVCKELGYDVVEFNASDTRSKKLLHQEVSELLSSNSLSPFFTGGDQVTTKRVLLMDEVDGMAGNEDRGGVQELILLIKQSRIPVICMCNDRNHPKIRSLANYCFDLRFSKPRAEQIRGAMMSICFKEKLKLAPDALTDIISSANQDIRLIINHLSMLAIENSALTNSTKFVKMGPWDVLRKIFSEEEHKSMSIHDKTDLFFHDYNVTPLFVQENYLNAVPHRKEAKNKVRKMELFAKAAKSLSLGDLTEKSIRSNNAWGLLPVQAVFSSLVPGAVLEGHIGAQINFPAWFGKNSRQTKMSRLVQELTVHSRLKISGNKEAMNLDYAPVLENNIVTPLLQRGGEGVGEALSVLGEYCLLREDLESLAELCSWGAAQGGKFSKVDSKVKAAFTRAYNKTSAPTPYATVPIKKTSRTDVNSEEVFENSEEVEPDLEEEEEESELDTDSMILKKKPSAGKKQDKEVASSSSKGSKNSKRGKKK